MNRSKPEILAPAGDINALRSAVFCGADAVYLGLEDFNARKKAQNFTAENLAETVKFCHFHKTKVYVTLNTNVKEAELPEMRKAVRAINDAHADAVIATDIAVISAIKEEAPEIPVHLSTQAGVCNLEAAKFAESLGADRVVLARETSLEDVRRIKENTNLEIEYFVQGALCVAFSGKCLLSSVKTGDSGNRGRCLQPCRLEYSCGKTCGYLLSPKDISLFSRLKELEDAGVCSFKIEGRLRSPEYVAAAVTCCKEAVETGKPKKESLDKLKIAFNRGDYIDGYFRGNGGIIFPGVQSNVGLTVGKVIFADRKSALVSSDRNLSDGDGFKMMLEGKEISGGAVKILHREKRGYLIEAANAKVGADFNLTKTSENAATPPKTYPVSMTLSVSDGGEAKLSAISDGQAAVSYFNVQKATGKPTGDDEISLQLKKTADSGFTAADIKTENANGFFIPKSVLNGARREVLAKLYEKIQSSFKGLYGSVSNHNKPQSIMKNGGFQSNLVAFQLDSAEKLTGAVTDGDVIVYAPAVFSEKEAKLFSEKAKAKSSAKTFLRLPPQADGKDIALFERILDSSSFDGVMAENYYALMLAEKYGKKVFLGGLLNVYNLKALNAFSCDYFMPSAELSAKEISAVFGSGAFVYAYGRMPLMNFKHCPVKALYGSDCKNCRYDGPLEYADRKNFRFKIVRRRAANCYFDLLNSVNTDVRAKMDKLPFNFYVDLSDESADNAKIIAESFLKKTPAYVSGVTYGHLFRGVL